MSSKRIRIGTVPIDAVSLGEAIEKIDQLVQARTGGTVFTPNADHVVVSDHNQQFREAYAATDLSLVDGVPVLWAAWLLGRPLPMKISGSDLVMPVLRLAKERAYRVFFLGADPGVADLAKRKVEAQLPGVQIVGVDDSRIDMAKGADAVVNRINAAKPDLVLVALGAPKQELFCHAYRKALAPAVLLSIGASLDFVAGVRRRAPQWISNSGFEWLFRLLQEPRRLAYRYLVRDPQLVAIVLRTWLNDRRIKS